MIKMVKNPDQKVLANKLDKAYKGKSLNEQLERMKQIKQKYKQ